MSNPHPLDSHFRTSRRSLLSVGGAGLLGLTMPRLLQAADQAATPRSPARSSPVQSSPVQRLVAKAKSVVFLFQWGGPSHVDTFDMKPRAPEGIRSLYKQIPTTLPGLSICEHLRETAKVMDKVTLVHGVCHTMKNHNSAGYVALSGREPPSDDQRLRDSLDLFPAYGSVVNKLAPVDNGMPTFVSYPYVIRDGSVTPGQHASFLGKSYDPFLITEDPNSPNFKLPELRLPDNLSFDRLTQRRAVQQLINSQLRLQESAAVAQGLDAYYDRALQMLQSSQLKQAFDLSLEPDRVRQKYGRTPYGQSCLLARRLVEAGVKFVNVYFSDTIGGRSTTDGGWDTHGFDNTRMYPILQAYHLPITDHTLPVFLNDLEDRGLLDETLVIWMGEFGRTPKINANVSRDHWPFCYTVLLAGGGVKRGYIHGASDKNGAYPDRDRITPGDIAATMFQLLGVDPSIELHDNLNRPLPLANGQPLSAVIA